MSIMSKRNMPNTMCYRILNSFLFASPLQITPKKSFEFIEMNFLVPRLVDPSINDELYFGEYEQNMELGIRDHPNIL